MRKITILRVEYTYLNTPDSEARLDRFYSWLINKAIDNLLKKKKAIDNNSTQKYSVNNGQSGRISNPRGSSKNTQSKENHHLQDVQSRQAPCSEVWQGLENKQSKTNRTIEGKI